jgi:release factor glutamine methyltransferase
MLTATIGAALESAQRRLQHQSSSPTLDAQVLLAATLGRSRAWLLAHPEIELSDSQARSYVGSLEQVLAGTALPHVLGEWEFYGRRFRLSPAVLIPRPETELVVERALKLAGAVGPSLSVFDVGTGCGCLAITLALELPAARVVASDVSRDALRIAQFNANAHGVTSQIGLVQADLLDGLLDRFDLVCANLPYVRTAELGGLLGREPRLALDGGADGLLLIRRLINDLPRYLRPGGGAVLEIDPRQTEQVVGLAHASLPGSTVDVFQDLAGRDRVVVVGAGDSRAD